VEKLEVAWLALLDELQARAPVTRAAIRPPRESASDDEARLPVPLNAELQSWFRLHDGCEPGIQGEILPFNTPVDLPTAVEDTLFRREIWQAIPDVKPDPRQQAGEIAGTWLDGYVAISRDGMGGGIFADLRPGLLHGCVRWWDKVEVDDFDVLAPSVAALLADVTDGLSTGRQVGGWTPHSIDGVIGWSPH
jgi:cell wall assembly regulator SMI1